MKNRSVILVALALLLLSAMNLQAQLTSATLTGVVSDPTGAVVPQAKVTLVNEKTRDTRDTVTNNDGYYTFVGISVGDYTFKLTVAAKGFQTYDAPGISLLNGDKRNINVSLVVGSTSEKFEVVGVADTIVPVDSGEKSETLTTTELQNYIQVGSNAAEYIKIMPGFGIANGTNNKANYDGEVIGINANGDAGSASPLNGAYQYNGLPGNSLDITSDGAHVSDPGCNCDTPVNPNSDMISEFKVMSGNFSAENQKGPMVISSVAKSGGSQFHGSAFFYARDYVMNSTDWIFNKETVAQPHNKYFYPGGTFGGPVLIPGTNFNKNRNKLFFFTGFEYFYQVLDTGLLRATVPPSCELSGNFSPACTSQEGPITASGGPPGVLTAAAQALFPGGMIPSTGATGQMIDPNMIALMKLYPAANANAAVTGGYNYTASEIFNENNTQWMTRVDYSISDSTKLFIRYNLQRETQLFPVGLWWRQTDQVPYPTDVKGLNKSDSVSASLTHVFSPTMTNEFVFSYTFIGFPNVFSNPSAVNRADVGYTYTGLYKNGIAQIPSFGGNGWVGEEAAIVFNPSGFEAGGATQGLYADKWMPNLQDTVSKVIGTHTIKGGFFWEWIRNAQPSNGSANGQLGFWMGGNGNTYGNEYADFVTGNLSSYSEQNFDNINDIAYNTAEGFVQDDWKVNKRLTVNLGIRLTHMQPWYDNTGHGFPIWDAADYSSTCTPAQYCGFLWHTRDPSVPLTGFPSRALYYQPRIGIAYDLTGSGKTVLRGGWGRYYYHTGQFTNGLAASAGVTNIGLGTNYLGNGIPLFASELDTLSYAAAPVGASAVSGTNSDTMYTDTWNVTVSHRTPWSSLLELSYVGNRSEDLPLGGGAGSDINLIPYGAMLSSKNGGVDPNSLNGNNFRPLTEFGQFNIATYGLYANFEAFQATWVRSKGRYNINMNYTFGKSMGILNSSADPYNIANDYGEIGQDRKHIFNAAYSIELGSPIHGNKFAGGFINGWQLSGITQLQSGVNLGGTNGPQFGAGYNNYKIPGTTFNVSQASILGTTDMNLNPLITCNPAANLAPHQFVNGNCFAIPTVVGGNGPTVMPAVYGPWYFNSDLGLFKNFQISESKKLQFRFDGYNFLNHPLWSFYNGENLSLSYNGTTGALQSPLFGYTTDKQGNRIIQCAVKFYF